LVVRLQEETRLDPVPHLTCVCHSTEEVDAILSAYASHGISNVMALGGDPPRDWSPEQCGSRDFPHAVDLVRHIMDFNSRGGHPDARGFGIGVAGFPEGHPDTPNRLQEVAYLKEKVEAGADYICTQLFFDNRDFLDFRERCSHAGITVPIVAGLMPVLSRRSFERIPDLARGSRYPAKLLRRIDACTNDEEIARVGMEWTIGQARELLDEGVAGLHFYTLNRARVSREIFEALGLHDLAPAR
jgi:methylenetetrahydrofolate reductase (NADPH)